MTAREDNPWVEVAVKVPCEMDGLVRAIPSSLVPSMMWQNEKKKSGTCLLKTTVAMDGQVDRILSRIDEALRQVEAKHLVSEPMPILAASGSLPWTLILEPSGRPEVT